jgi:ABC-type transport system substrate-binding protein
MKKTVFLKSIVVAALLTAVMLLSCGKKTGTVDSGSQAKDVAGAGESIVRIGILNNPGTLNPFAPRSGGGIATHRSIFEFLIDRDEFGGEMIGALMKSWKKIDDVTFDLTVYDYIYDTAGNHLTASDVKFSYDTAKASGNLPKLTIIKNIDLIDEYTARFTFTTTLAVGELEAIWSEMPVVTEAAYKASPDNMATSPVGTTAYKITEYTPASKIILKRTGKYWQTDSSKKPLASFDNVETIEFHIIPEAAQLAIALETGSIDITGDITNAIQVRRFSAGGEQAANFKIFPYLNNPVFLLLPNFAGSSLFNNNIALRQAIAYAIDTKGIAEGVYGNNGMALVTVGSEKYGDFNPKWNNEPYYEYDLAKAKQLMAQGGYPNGGLNLKLICLNNEDQQNMATIIQGYLGEIGITATITIYDQAMLKSKENEADAYDLILDGSASTDYLVNLWKLFLNASNYNGHTINFITDSRLQNMLDECISVQGHTQENVDAFHYYLRDNMYLYGLATSYGSVIGNNKKMSNVLLDSRNQLIPGGCTYIF